MIHSIIHGRFESATEIQTQGVWVWVVGNTIDTIDTLLCLLYSESRTWAASKVALKRKCPTFQVALLRWPVGKLKTIRFQLDSPETQPQTHHGHFKLTWSKASKVGVPEENKTIKRL